MRWSSAAGSLRTSTAWAQVTARAAGEGMPSTDVSSVKIALPFELGHIAALAGIEAFTRHCDTSQLALTGQSNTKTRLARVEESFVMLLHVV